MKFSGLLHALFTVMGLVVCLIGAACLIYALNVAGESTSRELYPVTYEYFEENITERMCAGTYVLISDTGNRYAVDYNLFWNTTPSHRYRIERAYNYSWVESTLTLGKTRPVITNITRIGD